MSNELGVPIAAASEDQLAAFERGKVLVQKRIRVKDGLGPEFNVVFCGACHEKPTFGGSAGRYRNFNLIGYVEPSGSVLLRGRQGVLRQFTVEVGGQIEVESDVNLIATRNPIPFFGAGLINEILESAIRQNADEFDEDEDGISGRVNTSVFQIKRRVGKFGRKAQTASLEGFIRGPFMNHVGLTSSSLGLGEENELPPILSRRFYGWQIWEDFLKLNPGNTFLEEAFAQGAAKPGPLEDEDGISDPELSRDDLFDLISFVQLLAGPRADRAPSNGARRGRVLFDELNCGACHIPTLESPQGAVPLYSDLLLHDMGEELADGFPMGFEATGSEFRTQPLWGLAAVGPYLHDGRADTLDQAIRFHGGEAEESRDAFLDQQMTKQEDLIAFLESLGGKGQRSLGLLEPDQPIPGAGEVGGAEEELTEEEKGRFERGRILFDREFGLKEGLGTQFNGDSCRACHFEPAIGGAGPLGVNVTRHGLIDEGGNFSTPSTGTTMAHRFTTFQDGRPFQDPFVNFVEKRQTPSIFGLGLLDQVSDAMILENEDPTDSNGDGISGRAHLLKDGRVGRFGWKANVPSLPEFARDAMTNELGISVPKVEGLTFGEISDSDEVSDPEIQKSEMDDLVFFMRNLAAPKSKERLDETEKAGKGLFEEVKCSSCHIPFLELENGKKILAYTNLLLHEVWPGSEKGIEEGDAGMREFRTPPLWGVKETAPYLHDGRAETLKEAILNHFGEAENSRQAFENLSNQGKDSLLKFLKAL